MAAEKARDDLFTIVMSHWLFDSKVMCHKNDKTCYFTLSWVAVCLTVPISVTSWMCLSMMS